MPFLLCLLLTVAAFTASATVAFAEKIAQTDAVAALSAPDVKIYRAAFAAAERGQWAEARMLAAQGRDPLPAKMIQWLDLTEPGSTHPFEALRAFLEANPDWPGQATLQAQAERAMPDDLAPDAVLRWFGERWPRTIRGTIHFARAMLARGLEQDAVALVRRDWQRLDMDASDEREFLALFQQHLKTSDHIARLDRLLWDRQQAAARRMLGRVDAGHRALAEARLRLMSRRSGVDAAIAAVPPELARDPGLVYERSVWRRRHGKEESIVELLDPPIKDVRRPDRFWNEAGYAARMVLESGDAPLAYRLARHHGATEGLTFAEGEWLAGWIALRFLNEPQTAYAHFTRLYAGVSSAVSQARGAYWAGRAAEAMGDAPLAQNWYETAAGDLTTFYGQLAAHRLDRDVAMRFDPAPEPTEQERAALARNELARMVQILDQLGESDRLRPFVIRLTELAKSAAEYRLISDLVAGLGRDDLAVLVARNARRAGIELVEYLYPLRPLPEGVDVEHGLILAMMRQESGFAADAMSHAGARGLMQLMPTTARQVARRLDLDYSRDRLTTDPEFNIRLGSAYFEMLLQRLDGSYLLAIAAYNAGPSRVLEWMERFGDPRDRGVDPIDWIESIPFSETRNYVQRVLETLQVYRHRLGEPLLALSLQEAVGGRTEGRDGRGTCVEPERRALSCPAL